MGKKDIETISRIIVRLVVKNVLAGATLEKAKDQAFNRFYNEYPKVLEAWLR